MNSIPAQLPHYQNLGKMHPANYLALQGQQPNLPRDTDFQKSNHALSTRSIKFNLIDSRARQKERENSFQEKESNRAVLPMVARSTHRQQFEQNSLNKSRGYIGDNMTSNKKKYEFGDEGVRVTQGVVEKYKASNYTIQRDMLQRFKRQAEELRRNRNNKGKAYNPNQTYVEVPHPAYRNTEPNTTAQNISFVQLRSDENERKAQYERELQRRNKVIQQMQEEQQIARRQQQIKYQKQQRKKLKKEQYIQRQKENLVQVGNMLREIDQKIKQTSQQLHSNLKELRHELSPKNQLKVIKIVHNKFAEPIKQEEFQNMADQLLQLQNSASCKLPVVMYNNRYYDARAYYGVDADLPQRIERKSCKNSAAQLQNIVSILRKNQHRLKMLTQETQY